MDPRNLGFEGSHGTKVSGHDPLCHYVVGLESTGYSRAYSVQGFRAGLWERVRDCRATPPEAAKKAGHDLTNIAKPFRGPLGPVPASDGFTEYRGLYRGLG